MVVENKLKTEEEEREKCRKKAENELQYAVVTM